MKTNTLIQASAKILRITELNIGDTVKIVKDTGYSDEGKRYGIVLDLLNTGEKTFIEVLLFKYEYSGFSAEVKLFKGNEDVAIFPATPEDIKANFTSIIEALESGVTGAENELNRKVEALEKAKSYMSGKMTKTLKASSYEAITQVQFENEKKQLAIEAKKKEIAALT